MKNTWRSSEICEKNEYVIDYACEDGCVKVANVKTAKTRWLKVRQGVFPSEWPTRAHCVYQFIVSVRWGEGTSINRQWSPLRLDGTKSLKSISRARLDFRRRPFLCTTLCRNPIQASNFSGAFDQLFLWIFYAIFTDYASPLCLYHGAKKSKLPKAQIKGGPALINFMERVLWFSVSA